MRNLKRALSLTLASVMLLGMMVMGSSALSFNDADDISNVTAASVLEELGVMQGDGKGNFMPEQSVTRAQMAIIICRILYGNKLNVSQFSGTTQYTDVGANDYYTGYINLATSLGIINGYGDGRFGPDDTVTTAQAALMLSRALGYFQGNELASGDWALTAIAQATKLKMFGDLKLNTNELLARDNVAEMVFNTLTKAVPVMYNKNFDIYYNDSTAWTNGVTYNWRDTLGYTNFSLAYQEDVDDFQRPTIVWGKGVVAASDLDPDGYIRSSYFNIKKDDQYTTEPKEATYTYYGSISNQDLYRAVGSALVDVDYTWYNYRDGQFLNNNKPVRNNSDAYQSTDTGMLTQVYVNSVDKTVVFSTINTYLAEVTRVRENANDVTVTLNYYSTGLHGGQSNSVDLPSTTLAQGDMVTLSVYQDASRFSIAPDSVKVADTAQGTVSAIKTKDVSGNLGKYAVMDGKNYNYVTKTFAGDVENRDSSDPSLNTEHVLYLDTYGNLLGFKALGRSVDYLYMKDSIKSIGGVEAEVVFADGTKEIIKITEVDGVDTGLDVDGSYGDNGIVADENVYAYAKNGSSYKVWTLENGNGVDGSNRGQIQTAATSYVDPLSPNSGDISYRIKKGTNYTIRTDYAADGTGTDTVVNASLTNNTVFVDVKGPTTYTGYMNVPTMTDVDYIAVYDKYTNCDVIFITKGADNSTSDSYFYITDDKAVMTEADGTKYYEYDAVVDNDINAKVIFKGDNIDQTTGAALAAHKLYKIDTVTPKGEVTKAHSVAEFAIDGSIVATASYANGSTLRTNAAADLTGAAKNTANSVENFVVDKDTKYVYVETKYNNDGVIVTDKVGSGSLGMINTTTDNDSKNNYVFVIVARDKDDSTPVADLVYIVEPAPQADVTYYDITWEKNGATVTGDAASVAEGGSITFTVSGVSVKDVTASNGTITPLGSGKYRLSDVTAATTVTIDVKAQLSTTAKAKLVAGDSGIKLFWQTGTTKPAGVNAANLLIAAAEDAGYTNVKAIPNANGYEITGSQGQIDLKVTWHSSNDAVESWKGEINGKTVFVDKQTSTTLDKVKTSGSGSANEGLTSLAEDLPGTLVRVTDIGGKINGTAVDTDYAELTASYYIKADGFALTTGYVKVTAVDGGSGVKAIPTDEDYTIPAKASMSDGGAAKGTGVTYTVTGGAAKYADYETGKIPKAELTDDVTLAKDKVAIEIKLSDALKTAGWTIDDTGNPDCVAANTNQAPEIKVTNKNKPNGSDVDDANCLYKLSGGLTDSTGDAVQDSGSSYASGTGGAVLKLVAFDASGATGVVTITIEKIELSA